MANIILRNLQSRTSMAEALISRLKLEINFLKKCDLSGRSDDCKTEIQNFTAENKELQMEWKDKLIQAETRHGKKISDPPQASKVENIPPAVLSLEEIEDHSNEKVRKAKDGETKGQQRKSSEEKPVHVGRLDLRVGRIVSAKKHPGADALYVEEVDVGEDKSRTVISGLVKFIPLEEMQNRKAILLCNLKPSKMRGILSEAMVMCAFAPDKVEILSPPEDSRPGDLVYVEGFERIPDRQLNPKKKIFEACAPDLNVNDQKIATYKGIPWTVNGKFCTSNTLLNVQIK